MASVVGQKGQIVIEKPLRDALGLRPGYVAVQRLVDDHVEIHFYPPEHEESLRGVLANHLKRTITPEAWPAVREEAWSETMHSQWSERRESE